MDFRVKEEVILKNMGWDKETAEYPAGAYFIRNAGGVVTQDAIRSLMLLQKFVLKKNNPAGVYDIKILVVAHTHCGMSEDNGNPGDDAMNKEIEKDWYFCEKAPFSLESFPSPQLGVRRSIQRLVTSRWVSRRDEQQGRPLDILGQVYNVDNNTVSAVDYIIVKQGETWPALARRANGERNRGDITPDVLRDANKWADRGQLGTNEVFYIPPKP
jgi:hypothetical protein